MILKPESILSDFQLSAIKAFQNNFKGVKLKGCLFSFGRSLFTQFKKLRLDQFFSKNSNVRQWFQKIFICALIPIDLVEENFKQKVSDPEKKPALHGVDEVIF